MHGDESMLDCVPFVRSQTDLELVRDFYNPCTAIRVELHRQNVLNEAKENFPLWIDPGVDGFSENSKESLKEYYTRRDSDPRMQQVGWRDFYQRFPKAHELGNPVFVKKPVQTQVNLIVKELLDACAKFNPVWISVPQLPFSNDSSRNRINFALARASFAWKTGAKSKVQLVLPGIFSHHDQTKGKTQWGGKLKQIERCMKESKASVLWIANSQLNDANGRPSDQKRLEEQIRIYTHAKEVFKAAKLVGGPFWGLNLILWARQLVDYPAISLGGSHNYMIPGNPTKRGNIRVAVPPIFRPCIVSPELKKWLQLSVTKDGLAAEHVDEFRAILSSWAAYQGRSECSRFNTERYRRVVAKLQVTPCAGRALALYQLLSKCFVAGSFLDELPAAEKPATRNPQQVARQLMLLCLS